MRDVPVESGLGLRDHALGVVEEAELRLRVAGVQVVAGTATSRRSPPIRGRAGVPGSLSIGPIDAAGPAALLWSTFFRHAASTPLAPRTPAPLRKVRRDARLLITASNWPIPVPPSVFACDPRMMGRFGHLCKPAVAISTRPNLGTSAIVTTFWHPFADMAALEATGSVTLVRGEGSHVWDTQGNRYLDATAGLWFVNVGHGRTEIAEAAAAQMATLAAYHTFGDMTNEPTEAPDGARRRVRADRQPEGVPHERRFGLDRHRHEDRSPLLDGARRAATDGPDPP